jgi:peptidoglycan/LPS O-acetylase OafA/YrhL
LTLIYLGAGLILISSLTFTLPNNIFFASAAYMGSHSYSIYLWHVPLAIWGMPILSRVLGRHLSLGVYSAFYFLGSILFGILMALVIEFPMLKVRDRWFPSKSRALSTKGEPNIRPAPHTLGQEINLHSQS